jgi:heat shock protein HslJ
MACPEPLMKQEQEFNEALTATGSYQINGNVLELLERKKAVARFEPGKPQQ